MARVDIPWPTSSNPGSAAGEGGGRLINCYAYKDGDSIRWKPSPGLDLFSDFASMGELRGYVNNAGLLLAVIGNQVAQIDATGAFSYLEGQVAGDGPVTISINNAQPPNITISSNNGIYSVVAEIVQKYSTGVATGDFTPAGLPPINSVATLDGYFFLTTLQGEVFGSQLNSTDVSALSFTTAEARPDQLYRGVAYGQQYLACGADTIEVYQDAGTLPFPLARSTVIPIGIIGPWAIAGYEDGWGNPLIFVAQDGSVRRLDGYTPTRISSDDLESLIAQVADKKQLRASVYTFGGNAIWSLSSPTWTWEYNVTTGEWNERASYGLSRWLGQMTFNAFNKWVVSDVNGGKLYTIGADTRIEGSLPLIWGMDSGPVKQFPIRIQIPAAFFDFVLGQAPLLADPEVMLSWSHDGGNTWATPLTRSVGRQGNARGRVALHRIGLSQPSGVRYRFRVSDSAYTSFSGARCDAVARR